MINWCSIYRYKQILLHFERHYAISCALEVLIRVKLLAKSVNLLLRSAVVELTEVDAAWEGEEVAFDRGDIDKFVFNATSEEAAEMSLR